MSPGWQVSRGQIRTGLRFFAPSFTLRGERDKNKSNEHEHESANDGHQSTSLGNIYLRAQPQAPAPLPSQSPPPTHSPPPSPSPPPPSPSPTCVAPCVQDGGPRVGDSTSLSLGFSGSSQSLHQTETVGSSLSFNLVGSPSASAKAENSGTLETSKGTPSKELVGVLAGVLGSVVFILVCITAFLIVFMRRRRRRRRAQRMQSSLFTSPESMDMAARERPSYYADSRRSSATKSWIVLDTKSTSQRSKSTKMSYVPDVAFNSYEQR